MKKSIGEIWKSKKQVWITLLVILVACGIAMMIIAFSCKEYETISLQEHWKVTFDSVDAYAYQDVSIGNIPFQNAEKKDTITLSKVLPKNTLEQPRLLVHVSHCAIDVYLDEQHIYTYGDENYKKGALLGSGYFFVPLPEEYEGKTLSIKLRKVNESKFNYIEDTCIISAEDAMKRLVTDNLLAITITMFLFVMGLTELGGAVLLIRAKKPVRPMISVAAFSMLMATWLSCCNKTVQFFVWDYTRVTVIEYVAMYFLPIGVISIVYGFFTKPLHKKIARIAEMWFLALACTAVVTQLLHICNLTKYAAVFRASLLFAIVLAVIFMISERKVHRLMEEKIEISGLAIFFAFVFFETLRYCFKKNYDIGIVGNQSLLPVGVLIWIEAMLARFVLSVYRSFVSEMQHELLTKMAYTDSLTAISNRAKCEEVMQDYDEKKQPLLLINMDLNKFKEVNDTYGHSEGDRLLCVFANILQEIFGEIGMVGRMGGDEFIVIMDAEKEAYVEEFLYKLTQRVNAYNVSEKHPYLLQFAYGYAHNKGDISVTPWDVYKKADAKMYRCKRKQEMNEIE